MSDQPRVLITGASGFVGQHLCQHLLDKGYLVRGTFRTKIPGELRHSVEWVHMGDVGPDTDWSPALETVDFVAHLAALAHQIGTKGEGRIEEFMRTNADGTRQLAQTVACSPTMKRFVFISSVGAVKSLSSSRLTLATPCTPDTDYGRSKLKAEQNVQEILTHDIDWSIIRPALVYGPGNPGNMDRLLKLVRTRLPLPFGAIRNLRSFLFVGNLVALIEQCFLHPEASRQIYFASDGEDMSTPDLIQRLAWIAGQPVILLPIPPPFLKVSGRLGDWMQRVIGRSVGLDSYSVQRLIGSLYVDTSPLTDTLDWRYPFSVEQGIRLTLKGSCSL
jgi:nucleoside-diphosphate-sugar epimerase